MKKMLTLTLSLLTVQLLAACGPAQLPGAAPNTVRAQASGARSLNLNKPESAAVKAGSTELKQASKGQPKTLAPFVFEQKLDAVSRDLNTSEVMTLARIGLDSMERASSYESGYNIGRSTLENLARHNSFVAKIAVAGTDPEMKYESAYKFASRALVFIANNRDISIPSICDLIRDGMNAAKSYEDGSRIAYSTMSFIRDNGASYQIRSEIDSSVRAAQAARYWEDSYNILYSSYGNIRYMK